MKLLIATGLYPPEIGGPATYTKLLEKELPKRGIEVVVLPFREVRRLPPMIRHIVYFFKVIVRSRGCDLVYAQDTVSVGFPAMAACIMARKKFVVRVPGDHAWEQGRQRFGVTEELDVFQTTRYGLRVELLRALEHFVVRRAAAVIVPSDYMKKIVSTWTDFAKIHRIYSSIHMPVSYTLPQNRPEGFLVVSAARRVPWKGIEAIERTVAKEKNWHFFLAENLPHEQAMGWIKTADVFVLNSLYEGLSHVLIEAMSLGTPVVATNVGGNPELIANGSEGWLITLKDEKALRAVLKEIEEHPDEARARAARAQERAQQFSIDVTIEQLVALLKIV